MNVFECHQKSPACHLFAIPTLYNHLSIKHIELIVQITKFTVLNYNTYYTYKI